jgi:mannosidase alpha-like ER degradation enhancer 1
VGKAMYTSLQRYSRVSTGGFASIRDVATMTQEDHQQSFFLAETCKYLYLLFNNR